MRLLLVFLLALPAQIAPAPSVKLAWNPYTLRAKDGTVVAASKFDVWKAPLTTSCGAFTRLGSTGGLWLVDRNVTHGGRYCYALQAEITLDGAALVSERSASVVAIVP